MTPETFISSIKTDVHDSSVRGVIETLQHPAGRKPPQRVVELSQWFHSLSSSDRVRVEQVIQLAVHNGIFGLLAILDGVRTIEKDASLELSCRRNGKQHSLTGSSQEFLHDIYQSDVYEQVFGSAG
jgi:hypothetical protein